MNAGEPPTKEFLNDLLARGGSAVASREEVATVVGRLVFGLRSADPDIRAFSALGLGRFPSSSDLIVPELIRMIDDPDLGVRGRVLEAMQTLGPVAVAAVPSLVRRLGDQRPTSAEHTREELKEETLIALCSVIAGHAAEIANWLPFIVDTVPSIKVSSFRLGDSPWKIINRIVTEWSTIANPAVRAATDAALKRLGDMPPDVVNGVPSTG
jgi:hypothetical protein